MIAKTKAYTDSTGAVHATLEAAQRAELFTIFPAQPEGGESDWTPAGIVNTIFDHSDRVRDVLSTGPKSRPGARAVNKAKKASPATVKDGLAKARKAVDAPATT